MRAHCDWCGMDVEVLASGKCLLGHPINMEKAVPDTPEPEPVTPRDLLPGDEQRRGRVRKPLTRPAPPVEPPAGRTVVAEPEPKARSIRTAPTPPAKPRIAPTPPPVETNAEAKVDPPVEVAPNEPAEEIEDFATRVSRPWAPVEPDGPSGPIVRSPTIPVPEPVAEREPAEPSEIDERPAARRGRMPFGKRPAHADAPEETPPSEQAAVAEPVTAEPPPPQAQERSPFAPPPEADVAEPAVEEPEAAPPPPPAASAPSRTEPAQGRLRSLFGRGAKRPDARAATAGHPRRAPGPAAVESDPASPRPAEPAAGAPEPVAEIAAPEPEAAAAMPEPAAPAPPPPPPIEPPPAAAAPKPSAPAKAPAKEKPAKPAKPAAKSRAAKKPAAAATAAAEAVRSEPAAAPAAPEAPPPLPIPEPPPPIRPARSSVGRARLPDPTPPAAPETGAPTVTVQAGADLASQGYPSMRRPRRSRARVAGASRPGFFAATPRNAVGWGLLIAATFLAGVAALAFSPGEERDDGNRPTLRSITLSNVAGHTVRPDPDTEARARAELASHRSAPRLVSAAQVLNPDGEIVAHYESIVFGDDIGRSDEDLDLFIRLYAEGAGITPDAFTQRRLGRRMIWSGLLSQGQAVLLFRGPEVVIVITAETGAAGDTLADVILTARNL